MNSRVASYRATCEALAAPLVGRNRAEFDDLVQEGLINVWQSLQRGVTPSKGLIERRMVNWIRLMGVQRGKAQRDPIAYEVMLPLDDFTEIENARLEDVAAGERL
jgi:DNA-directed RNA polymerase specialized sigma24 family protein